MTKDINITLTIFMNKYMTFSYWIFKSFINLSIITICIVHFGYAQETDFDQNRVDRLKTVYESDKTASNSRKILRRIAQDETDPEEKLRYSNLLIVSAEDGLRNSTLSIDSVHHYLSTGYLHKGNAYQLIGELHEAIDAYFKCKEYAKKEGDENLSASILVSIADTYSMIGNSESAEKYYDESLILLRQVDDSISLASALLNAGDEYLKTKKFDKALLNFKESSEIFELKEYPVGMAYNKGNIGMVFAEQGRHELAKANINEAITILEEIEDYYPISVYLNAMSEIYVEQNDYTLALVYAERSLELAKKYNLKDQISEANLQLSQLLEQSGNPQKAFDYYKDHIAFRDSVINIGSVQKIANLEVTQKELEVENLEQKRKNQRIVFWSVVGILLFIGYLAYSLYKRNKFVHKTNKIIEAEKQRSDNLLLNILPEETAKELKDHGRVDARRFEAVTVLFADFKGFTHYAENLSPEVLVQTIDHYFSAFDLIMETYDLEKIKTIGDAYMAAGGLPFETEDHAYKMILAAKDMVNFVANAKEDDKTTATFDIRIGINTGPVVAGVVGTKKFAYDIWGDTVNIASRMESNSEPARINISEATYNIVNSKFNCEYRGEIAIKNRGQMKMYFVNN